jgi:hypothetical protein
LFLRVCFSAVGVVVVAKSAACASEKAVPVTIKAINTIRLNRISSPFCALGCKYSVFSMLL